MKMPSLRKTELRPAAVAAATWWAEKLGMATTNGTDDGMAAALMLMVQASKPLPTDDEASKFVALLAGKVHADLDRLRPGMTVTLATDYGPEGHLADVAREIGLRAGFPMKTCMWVTPEVVTASLGYQASERLVWASPEWLASRPACGSQQWQAGNYADHYHGDPFVCSLPRYHEERDHRYDQPIALCASCGRREGGDIHDLTSWMAKTAHTFVPA